MTQVDCGQAEEWQEQKAVGGGKHRREGGRGQQQGAAARFDSCALGLHFVLFTTLCSQKLG